MRRKDYSPTAGAVPPPSQGRDYCNPFFSQQTERFRKFQTKVKFYRLLKKAKTLFVPPQGGEGGTRRVTGEDAPSQTNLCVAVLCIGDRGAVRCPRFASASMCHFAAIAGRPEVAPYGFVRRRLCIGDGAIFVKQCGIPRTGRGCCPRLAAST